MVLANQEFLPFWACFLGGRAAGAFRSGEGPASPAPLFPFFALFPQPLVAFKMATLALAAVHNWNAFSSSTAGYLVCRYLLGG